MSNRTIQVWLNALRFVPLNFVWRSIRRAQHLSFIAYGRVFVVRQSLIAHTNIFRGTATRLTDEIKDLHRLISHFY